MSEEIIENKFGNKDDNIEDPNIVAQRLLNIFRQLHIFSPEKKASFNEMILSQPKVIKDAFGKLLGGAYLKEYIEILESQDGYIKTHDDVEEVFKETDSGYINKQSKNINNPQNNNNNNINIEELIANITKNQTDLISDLTKIQTAQLAEIISLSLQETYKSTTKSLVDALTSKNIDTKNIENHIKQISKNVDSDFKNNIEKTKKKFEENTDNSKNISSASSNINPIDRNRDRNVQKPFNQNKQNNKPDIKVYNNQNKPITKYQADNKFIEEIDVQNSNSPINLAGISSASFDKLLKDDKNNDDWRWLEESNKKEKALPKNIIPVIIPEDDSSEYIDLGEDDDFDDSKLNEFIDNTAKQKTVPLEVAEAEEDGDWEWDYEEVVDDVPATAEEDGDWEWDYEEEEDQAPSNIDSEVVAFEEKELYPERQKEIKPAPLTSESIIEKEGIFRFDNFEDNYEKKEPLEIVNRANFSSSSIPEKKISLPLSSKELLEASIENSLNLPKNKVVKEKVEELDLNDLIMKEEIIPIEKVAEIKSIPQETSMVDKSLEGVINDFVVEDVKFDEPIISTEKIEIDNYIEDLEALNDKKILPKSSKELLEIHKNKEKISKELEDVKIGLVSSNDDENIDGLYK